MSALPADRFLADNWKYLLAALVLHAAVVVMLTLNWQSSRQVVVPSQLAISAVMVDHTAARIKREKAEADRVAREQAEAEQKAHDAAEEKQREQEKIALETKRAEEKRAEEKRATEKKADEKRQQQVAVEQKKKTEERDKQAATKKQAATDAKKREADIKTKQAEKLKNERDAREQAQRESELKRQLADEEGREQAKNAGALNQYVGMVQQRIERNWTLPDSARPGVVCVVTIRQTTGGVVLSVTVGKCNGDAAVRQSVESAVYRSSPLPLPDDMRLFEREFVFTFRPR